jgi:hypothetical protein
LSLVFQVFVYHSQQGDERSSKIVRPTTTATIGDKQTKMHISRYFSYVGPVRLSYKPYFFNERTLFFSHNKSANNTCSHGLSAKRTEPSSEFTIFCYFVTIYNILRQLFMAWIEVHGLNSAPYPPPVRSYTIYIIKELIWNWLLLVEFYLHGPY